MDNAPCALLIRWIFVYNTAQTDGDLRLVKGSTTSYTYTSGRLEIYDESTDEWGTICNDADFDLTAATVACQQLGWTGAFAYGDSEDEG